MLYGWKTQHNTFATRDTLKYGCGFGCERASPKNSRPDKLELPVVHSIPKASESELEESGEQTYVADRVDIIAKEIEGTEVCHFH